jgi:hypothetical protein
MKKLVIVSAMFASLLMLAMQPAYAISITGNVKSGGVGLGDAKVTAERVGEYKWTRTATSGTVGSYSLTVGSTSSYTVAGMKTSYTRASATVNGGSAAPDLNLSARSLTNIIFKIAFDTSAGSGLTIDQARFYLYSAEPWFREEHSIDFQETGPGTAWSTSDVTQVFCDPDMNKDMQEDVNWVFNNYGIAEMLIGFTGKQYTDGTGCINGIPTQGGTHPYMQITNWSPDIARTVMHEVSHAYGLPHASCFNAIPGIMASTCNDSIYIKNWVPADDTTMESRRGWY